MSLSSSPIHSANSLSDIPSPVQPAEMAMPAFIGYTEKAFRDNPADLVCSPVPVHSLAEYEAFFGKAKPESKSIRIQASEKSGSVTINTDSENLSPFVLYYSIEWYFLNGGGPCYIVSAGSYEAEAINIIELETALHSVEGTEDVTVLVIPDAYNLHNPDEYYDLFATAMDQCSGKKNRFLLMDVPTRGQLQDDLSSFRNRTLAWEDDKLKNVAAYYPSVYCNVPFILDEDEISIELDGNGEPHSVMLSALKENNKALAEKIAVAFKAMEMKLPISVGVAAKMVFTDRTLGVWKAPAGMPIEYASRPALEISDNRMEEIYIDPSTSRAVNMIRNIAGKGNAIIWGARTLTGGEPDWKYIPVRRTCMMIEKSLSDAAALMKSEPNNNLTWTSFRQQAEDFLYRLWREGAMPASKPEEAYFVKVGPGITMTETDVELGIMIAEVGVSLLRPAEFITLRISQQVSVPDDNGSGSFSLRRLQTGQQWDDLNLQHENRLRLKELEKVFSATMKDRPGPAPYVMFQGYKGSGRKRSAAIIGRSAGMDVYRVDLSAIISKYIGETEKNLDKLFSTAEEKKWILYFDEADALFGRRTDIRDSHARYGNQEISYLLQRLEQYGGPVIFGTGENADPDCPLCEKLHSRISFKEPAH